MPYTPKPMRAAVPVAALFLFPFLVACDGGDSPLGVEPGTETILQSVLPEGGATDVDPSDPVTLTFSHPMNPAMSEYVNVHEEEVAGPVVPGSWTWSDDATRLTFIPDEALKPATTYVIHMGGDLHDAWDRPVDCEEYGPGMGGQWAWGDMMGGSGGGPMMGGGSGSGAHMGDGWQHANGSYGMTFTFTTSG